MKSNLTLFDFLMHVPVIELVVPKHKVKSYRLLRFFFVIECPQKLNFSQKSQ